MLQAAHDSVPRPVYSDLERVLGKALNPLRLRERDTRSVLGQKQSAERELAERHPVLFEGVEGKSTGSANRNRPVEAVAAQTLSGRRRRTGHIPIECRDKRRYGFGRKRRIRTAQFPGSKRVPELKPRDIACAIARPSRQERPFLRRDQFVGPDLPLIDAVVNETVAVFRILRTGRAEIVARDKAELRQRMLDRVVDHALEGGTGGQTGRGEYGHGEAAHRISHSHEQLVITKTQDSIYMDSMHSLESC
ncbi:MAG: hypothetical protein VW582_01185 [Rhodospirillaceae bacterium]